MRGYVTEACCGGHYNGGCSEALNVDLSLLEKYQNDSECFIREIREDGFDCYVENRKAHIYILFAAGYDFEMFPDGFSWEEDEYEGRKRILIECDIDYFDEKNHKKKRNEIENELDEKCNILIRWVKKLPDINKGRMMKL